MATEQNMLDALIQHQAYSYRASTQAVNELLGDFTSSSNQFVSQLRDLLDELTDAEKDALIAGKYTTDSLKEVKTLFDEFYSVMVVSLPETFAVSAIALATYEATYISKLYGEEIALSGAKILSNAKKLPITGGQLFDDVWKNLADSTRKKALYAVREGLTSGLTIAQIVKELKGERVKKGDRYEYVGGILSQAKTNIEADVRTIRSHVSNTAMVETFSVLGLDYLKFVSVLDGRTSKGCAVLDGTVWKKGDKNIVYPPRHYNCRSILVGVDQDGKMDGKRPFVMDERKVKDIPKDERKGLIGQLDANTSFPKFFEKADSFFQKEWLGETRYKLYKDGKFPLSKFVDPLGKEYTIAELRALDEKVFKELDL